MHYKKIMGAAMVATLLASITSVAIAEGLNNKTSQSYAAGVSAARLYLPAELDMDFESFIKGLRDAYGKKQLQYTEKQLAEFMGTLQATTKRKAQINRTATEAEGRQIEPVFFEVNKQRFGVQTLDDGLQYKVIKEAKDPSDPPVDEDVVTIVYKSTSARGALIASNQSTNPLTVKVSSLSKPLREGVKMMSEGAKWEFYVPPELAQCHDLTDSLELEPKIIVYQIELKEIKRSENSEQVKSN